MGPLPAVAMAGAFALLADPTSARPAHTLADLSAKLSACSRLRSPEPAWTGAEITVRFSLRRDGHVIGRPRITYSRLPASAADERSFVAAALSALESCFPVEISDGLGGAIAGRMMTIRIGASGQGEVRAPQLWH